MGTIAITALMAVLSAVMTYAQYHSEEQHQNEILNQQQDFQREREDIAYQRDVEGDATRFRELEKLGVNPNIAMQSILGGSGFQPSVVDSAPPVPSSPSAISALGSTLSQSAGQLQDSFLKSAQIRNIEANTNKTDIESGLLPRDFELRTRSIETQIKLWNKSVDKIASEIGLNDEQKKLVEQQNLFYGRMSEAEIKVKEETANKIIAETSLAYQKVNESKAQERELDARTAVDYANVVNLNADTSLKNAQTDETWNKAERERIAKEFEIKMGYIPLTVDAKQYLHGLVVDGKFDDAQRFLDCVFQSALAQEVGHQGGIPNSSVGLPLNILNFKGYNPFKNHHFNVDYQSGYTVPYWNPLP